MNTTQHNTTQLRCAVPLKSTSTLRTLVFERAIVVFFKKLSSARSLLVHLSMYADPDLTAEDCSDLGTCVASDD
jgi:hypothetical protein